MSTRLKIAPDFTLPAETFEDVVAILGRRGRGKTTTATVIVEELHAAGARFCVLDPTGVWHGLKSSRDGKRPGIPCVVMGGEHGDVPLAAESGEVIADFVADPASPSCVLDLKLFTQGELVRFATAFLARLFHRNRAPLNLILDEGDNFAPQRPMEKEQAMLGAAQRVTKMGRTKGLHPLWITQRPATLSKNVLTQAGLLIAHAITGPQDREAVDDWIKANADEGERRTFLAELSGLPRGTAYFWSPDLPCFRQVAVRDRGTFDSSATPKRGERRAEPKALAAVDLDALRTRIAATIEHAKANDPGELRKQLAAARSELAKAQRAQPAAAPAAPVEVSVLTDADRKKLDDAIAALGALRPQVDAAQARLVADLAAAEKALTAAIERGVTPFVRAIDAVFAKVAPIVAKAATARTPAPVAAPARLPARPVAPAAPRAASNGHGPADTDLGKCERRILQVLAQHGACESGRLALLSGYAFSGGFRNSLSALRTAGYMVGENTRTMEITAAGRTALGDVDPPPTGAALVEHWMRSSVFGKAERAVLGALVENPGGLTAEQLCQATGYEFSGGFRNTLSALRTAGVLLGKNTETMTAHPDLLG